MRTKDSNRFCVYIHIFPDNKKYIGLTSQEPCKRWANGEGYKSQPKIYNAICKFGWNNVKHEIYKDRISGNEAQQIEKELIKKFDSIKNGYNSDEGGCLGGFEWTRIEYNGDLYYPSELEELAVDGVTAHDITTRVGRGWDIKRALIQSTENRIYKREYNGKLYSIEELSKLPECIVDAKTIRNRLSRGWSVERALTQSNNIKMQPFTKIIKYNDKEISIKEAVEIAKTKYNNILTEQNIRDRLQKGYDIETALSKRKIKGCNILHEYNGKQFTTVELSKIAKEKYGLNLSRSLLASRLRKGMTVEEAISSPLKTHKHKYS